MNAQEEDGLARHWREERAREQKALKEWRCPACGQPHPLPWRSNVVMIKEEANG